MQGLLELLAVMAFFSPPFLVVYIVIRMQGGLKQAAYKRAARARGRAIEQAVNEEEFNQHVIRELQRRGRI